MNQQTLVSLKRLVVLTAALAVAFGSFMGIVTTSQAEADYHWLPTFSDYFDSVGGNVTAFDFSPSGKLYVGGDFTSAGREANGDPQIVNGLAMWDGTEWHPLGGGFGLQFGGILPSVSKIIAVSDTEVYISGFFAYIRDEIDSACPADCIAVRGIARWDGQAWSGFGPADSLGVSVPSYAEVSDMEIYNNEIWITGLFYNAGQTEAHGIAKWNGMEWEAVAFGDDHGFGGNGSGGALATDGTTLYIGGGFDEVDDQPAINIVRYTPDGGFQALGNGLPALGVSSMVVDGDVLYAGGYTNEFDTGGSLWRYADDVDDGVELKEWSIVGAGIWENFYNGTPGQVAKLFLDGDNLYVGGVFGRVGADRIVSNLAIWNTTTETWAQFGNPIGYPNGGVFDITKRGAQIFVGGGFTQIGGIYIQNGEDFHYEQGIQSLSLGIYDPAALPPPPEMDLDVNLDTSDSTVDVGQEVDVCLQIYNHGPDTVTGVSLTTSVPNGAVLVSAVTDECNTDGGGGGETRNMRRVNGLAFPTLVPDCTAPNLNESGAINCNLPDLAEFDSAVLHFTVQISAAAGSQVEFSATVGGTELDSNTGNNTAAQTVQVRPDVVYVSADGDCGANSPCYVYPGDALGALAQGGTLNLLPGEYYDSVYLYNNNTVSVTGNVILHGQLYIDQGTFNSTNGTLEITSSLENQGGTFNHNNGTVYLNYTGYQNIVGNFEFYNLIIGPETVITTQGVPLNVTGALTNIGTIYHAPAPQYVFANTPTLFTDGTNRPAIVLTSTGANDPGDTYVTVSMSEEPPACGIDPFPALAILRHFDISPGNYEGIQATLQLYYDPSELNGVNPDTVEIYHCGYNDETGEYAWELLESEAGPAGSYSVETTNVTSFSPFALGGSSAAPTATTLLSASAKKHKKGGVAVKWETGSELVVVGFNVLRSNRMDGNYKVLNENLKPAKHAGQPTGRKYTFRDSHAKAGKDYWYKIEVVKADGSSVWSDPIHVKLK